MKTITKHYDLYEFKELSEEVQEKVLQNLYDVNVDYDWWECTFEDARNIGLDIKEFDLDRGAYCMGELLWNAEDVAKAIVKEHGPECETHDIAQTFLTDYENLPTDDVDDSDELITEFINDLSSAYLTILRKEYEYLTSEEAIKETIECNEWTFLKDGTMMNG